MALSYAGTSSAVIPVRGDNPENARQFQREMFARKNDADRMEQEKKNWQIDWKQIDPLYHSPVQESAGKLSMYITEGLRKDPTGKFMNTPEYTQKLGEFRQMYDIALQGTANKRDEAKAVFQNPDHFVQVDPARNEAAKTGDFKKFVELNGGNPLYTLGTGYGPNMDLNKVAAEGIKFSTTSDQPKKEIYTDPKTGKKFWKVTPNISEDAGAQFITNLQHNNPIFPSIPGSSEYVANAIARAKQPIYQEIRPYKASNSGNGGSGSLNNKWTITQITPGTDIASRSTSATRITPYDAVDAKGNKIIKYSQPQTATKQFTFVAEDGYNFEPAGGSIKDVPKQAWSAQSWLDDRGTKHDGKLVTDGILQAVVRDKRDHKWYVQIIVPEKTEQQNISGKLTPIRVPEHNVWIPYDKNQKQKVKAFTADKQGLNGFEVKETTTTTPEKNGEVKQYTREELKALSPSYTDEVIDNAVKAGKIKLK